MHHTLLWRQNGYDGVSNHQPHQCLINRSFGRRSNKTSKLRVTGLCVGNSPGTGEFPAQMASNAENLSIAWRHHVTVDSNSAAEDGSVRLCNVHNGIVTWKCFPHYWSLVLSEVKGHWCGALIFFHCCKSQQAVEQIVELRSRLRDAYVTSLWCW